MSGLLHSLIDFGTSYGIKKMIEKYIANYGVVHQLHFDSKLKALSATLGLRGETRDLTIQIRRYGVRREAGKAYVRVEEISVDREWMEALAGDVLVGREFEVPGWVAMLL